MKRFLQRRSARHGRTSLRGASRSAPEAWGRRALLTISWGMAQGLMLALLLLFAMRPAALGQAFAPIETTLLDYWFALRSPRTSERVALVLIDEATLHGWNGRLLEESALAQAIDALDQSPAVLLAFDVAAHSNDSNPIAAAAARHGRVAAPIARAAHLHGSARADHSAEAGLLHPAHALFEADRFGRARSLQLRVATPWGEVPALCLVALDLARAELTGAERALNSQTSSGSILLNFPHGIDDDGQWVAPFARMPLRDLIESPGRARELAGRVVVIGYDLPALGEGAMTPVGNRVSRAELHAVAVDNLLTGDALRDAPLMWMWMLTILPAMVAGGFVARRRPVWSATVALLCFMSITASSLGLFAQNLWLDPTGPYLAVLGTFVVAAVGRVRRQEREGARVAATIEALTRVSDIIVAQTRGWNLLDRVLDFALGVLDARQAAAYVFDARTGDLVCAAARGENSGEQIGRRLNEQTARTSVERATFEAATGTATFHQDDASAGDQKRFEGGVWLTGQGASARVVVPLRVGEQLLGAIEVAGNEEQAPFGRGDVQMLQAVANQAAVALENARLYDQLAQRVEASRDALALANRQLQADKALLQTVLHSMTDGVVVTDGRATIRLINPAARRLLPELREAAPGQDLSALVPDLPLQNLCSIEACQDEIEAPVLYRGDVDAPRHIEVRCAPLRERESDEAGSDGMIAVLCDATQRRHIEQTKSDFVSFVAHEMRSPLTSISGFSAMLQRAEANAAGFGPAPGQALAPASRHKFLALIHEESERLTRLINNLLDVARLEAGAPLEIAREPVDFARIVRFALESQRAYSTRHTLRSQVPPNLALVEGDADKIKQVLINLLSNALKYSPGGLITVEAHTRGSWLEASVSDQGPGIAPEQLSRLFARFGRAPDTATGAGAGAKPTGTGLGLFLTKHLIEAHGGTIEVHSQPGRGATFTFTLPLAPEAEK